MKAAAFWSRVDRSGECWRWTGWTTPRGYGRCQMTGVRRPQHAHRVAYELLVGPIPVGLELDHLCRNPGCVNPAHLEPVTQAENKRRQGAAVAACRKGHEYSPENTYVRPNGRRMCRACNRPGPRRQARLRREQAVMSTGGTNGNEPNLPKPPSVPIPRPKAMTDPPQPSDPTPDPPPSSPWDMTDPTPMPLPPGPGNPDPYYRTDPNSPPPNPTPQPTPGALVGAGV